MSSNLRNRMQTPMILYNISLSGISESGPGYALLYFWHRCIHFTTLHCIVEQGRQEQLLLSGPTFVPADPHGCADVPYRVITFAELGRIWLRCCARHERRVGAAVFAESLTKYSSAIIYVGSYYWETLSYGAYNVFDPPCYHFGLIRGYECKV